MRLLSPTLAASIGLAILAFAAPGHAHAEVVDPDSIDPIAARRPYVDPDPEPEVPPQIVAEPPPPAIDYDRDRYARWRLSGGAGVRFGSYTVNGDSTGTAIPFHLDLGARRRRTFLFASYELFSIDANVPSTDPTNTAARNSAITQLGDGSGLVHRLGVTARYALGRFAENDGGLDLWTEAGLGMQHLRWDAGGTWTRPDLTVGVGATMLYLGKHKHTGFSIGLRVMIAPRNDTAGAPPVCGGPCDTATPPNGADRSFMFDLTMPYGS